MVMGAPCECASCHRAVHFKVVQTVNFMFCVFDHNLKRGTRGVCRGRWGRGGQAAEEKGLPLTG